MDEQNQLCWLPGSTRDHSPSDLTLPEVHPDSPRRRRFVVGTGYRGFLRDYSALGEPFRAHDRSGLAQAQTKAPHDLAQGEVYLKIDGRMVYLWRAVDTEGEVLDMLVQAKRDKHAGLKLMRKLLKKHGFVPDLLIMDDLRSYGAVARDLGIEKHHQRGRWR